jgi:hypothetical protein
MPAVMAATRKGWATVCALKRYVFTSHMPLDVRLAIYRTAVLPGVLYAAETCVICV